MMLGWVDGVGRLVDRMCALEGASRRIRVAYTRRASRPDAIARDVSSGKPGGKACVGLGFVAVEW